MPRLSKWAGILASLSLSAGALRGQNVYLVNQPPDGPSNGTVSVYNAATGATITTSLISGLDYPQGLALSGTNLWVVTGSQLNDYNATTGAPLKSISVSDEAMGLALSGSLLYLVDYNAGTQTSTIAEYNAITGGTVSATLVSGLANAFGIAASGNSLFVTNFSTPQSGAVLEYNASTGQMTGSFGQEMDEPQGVAVSGSYLYVTTITGALGRFNTTTGAGSTLANGPGALEELAVSGSDIYVGSYPPNLTGGELSEYSAVTGALLHASLPTDGSVQYPSYIVVSPVPEPGAWWAGLVGFLAMGGFWRMRSARGS